MVLWYPPGQPLPVLLVAAEQLQAPELLWLPQEPGADSELLLQLQPASSWTPVQTLQQP